MCSWSWILRIHFFQLNVVELDSAYSFHFFTYNRVIPAPQFRAGRFSLREFFRCYLKFYIFFLLFLHVLFIFYMYFGVLKYCIFLEIH